MLGTRAAGAGMLAWCSSVLHPRGRLLYPAAANGPGLRGVKDAQELTDKRSLAPLGK